MDGINEDYWKALDELVSNSEIVIDRPRGSAHPRFPNFIYKVDYGYLKNTSSMDGAGIDVWIGSGDKKIDSVVVEELGVVDVGHIVTRAILMPNDFHCARNFGFIGDVGTVVGLDDHDGQVAVGEILRCDRQRKQNQ